MPHIRVIVAGRTVMFTFALSDLEELPECERDALAVAIRNTDVLGKGYHLGGRFHEDVEAKENALPAIREILQARAKAYRERSDFLEHVIKPWVRQHGTDEQKANSLLGLMSPDEALGAIRAGLFAPFAGLPRYRATSVDICGATCNCAVNVTFGTFADSELPSDERERLRDIMARVTRDTKAAEYQFQPQRHTGMCIDCNCKGEWWGVAVTVRWNGHPFTLEYSLIDPKEIAARIRRRASAANKAKRLREERGIATAYAAKHEQGPDD